MQNEDVILGAVLRLSKRDRNTFEENIAYYKQRRIGLPKGKSMGCVFKNPSGVSAGKLIDGAGLKGLRIGGAIVSEKHANFIINDRSASAKDIRELISVMKSAVFAQYKIELEEEISKKVEK